MVGDQQDMLTRLKAVLPLRWFSETTPVLDAILAGFADGWVWVYALLKSVKAQTRIGTAQGDWLDLIAGDFFGSRLYRRSNEPDDAYRRRIRAELTRERGTRKGVILLAQDLTGRAPIIFEPRNPIDTGGYGGGSLAYDVAGGWGSLNLPFQFFITAYRPTGQAVAGISGWNCAGGGYGNGAVEYGSVNMLAGQVTDNDIFGAIASVLPIGTIAWTRLEG